MAKRKKGSKPKRAKRGNSAKRSKPRKSTKSAAKRAKPKPRPAKKVARKGRLPVGPAVETVAAEVIEQPASGSTEVEENTGK